MLRYQANKSLKKQKKAERENNRKGWKRLEKSHLKILGNEIHLNIKQKYYLEQVWNY